MTEEWRPVPSCPGMMASSLGFIRLPEHSAVMPNGVLRIYKTRPTRGSRCRSHKKARHKYYSIRTRTFGTKKVHRLVCEAFHGPAPVGSPVVIHLDENGLNNNASNLRWGTQKENLNMPGFKTYCKNRTGEKSPWAKHYRKAADV